MKKILMFLLLGLFFISLTSATVETLGVFKQNDCIKLIQSGSGLTECNITSVSYPNSSAAIENTEMTYRNNEFNYTFCNTSSMGTYIVNGFCGNGTDYVYWAYDFDVTITGQDFSSPNSLMTIGIIIATIAIMFLFMIFGFKLTNNENLYPIGFLFIIFSVIFSIYLLHQTYTFSSVILGLESFSSTTATIYIVVLWVLVGIAIISAALMLIAFIKEIGRTIERRKFGDDFEPIGDSYNI